MTTTRTGKTLRYLVTGALAASLVAGAAIAGDDAATRKAEAALSGGKADRAIRLGETAVEASTHSVQARLVLAQAYLKAGRFDAAATTFNDAMDLGDTSARTALSLALANTAAGRTREAV
ncbi:MAG TPA: tetratricopeptide repeat protein, partial [Novosphingobium sp.]|nr:tetratricopeptide repeat protein [Novosphingobium sp.]